MTTLPPPPPPTFSGFVINGNQFPFDAKVIEHMLNVNATMAAVAATRAEMDRAKSAGETDLLDYAKDYRIACTDEAVAIEELRNLLGKTL